MNIVVLGPQGSGKGTQSELISEKFNLFHIETGKILREIADSDHPLAQEIRKTMMDGKLVSDAILEAVIGEQLAKRGDRGFVFDGTPRDVNQYHLIGRILGKRGEKLDKVFLVNISEGETIKRLSSRRTCQKCGRVYNLITHPSPKGEFCECGGELIQRDDDRESSIIKRLKTYHDQTGLVIAEAERDGILSEVDGERPIDEIFAEIVNIIQKINV